MPFSTFLVDDGLLLSAGGGGGGSSAPPAYDGGYPSQVWGAGGSGAGPGTLTRRKTAQEVNRLRHDDDEVLILI